MSGRLDRVVTGAPAHTSRRVLVGCSLLFVVVGVLLVGSTGALFHSSQAANGTVQIDDDPTFEKLILDNSTASPDKVSYDFQYKVSWMEDFDHVDIVVQNRNSSLAPENYTSTEMIDAFEYRKDGSVDKNAFGDIYEFDFKVYDVDGNLVIHETVSDESDGNDTGDDMGTVDDPTLESFTVYDRHHAKADYLVEYQLSNTDRFQEVRVYFENLDSAMATDNGVRTNGTLDADDTGSVEFEKGGTNGDTYRITVRVVNTDGLVVDTGRVEDEAGDGSNTSWSR